MSADTDSQRVEDSDRLRTALCDDLVDARMLMKYT